MPHTPVNILFAEAAARLQIEESCSAVLTSLSYSKNDDKAAQSVHLGLCRVSSFWNSDLSWEDKTLKLNQGVKVTKIRRQLAVTVKG